MCFIYDLNAKGHESECELAENVNVLCENQKLVEWAECSSSPSVTEPFHRYVMCSQCRTEMDSNQVEDQATDYMKKTQGSSSTIGPSEAKNDF